jgi:hypothetical protein
VLILSQGIIRVDGQGAVKMAGVKRVYEAKVERFLRDLGARNMTVRYRNGRLLFSKGVDPSTQQKIRNFLVNIRDLV